MKIYLLALLVTICCPRNASAGQVSIKATYRPAANLFDILDCVSGWWDFTYCMDEGAYQKEWKKRFGLSEADRAEFKKYDLFRRRYFRGVGAPKEVYQPGDGLFAKKSSIHEDLIAPAFYSSQNLAEAFAKLETEVKPADLKFLKGIFQRFEKQLATLAQESEPFRQAAEKLNSALQDIRYSDFYSSVSNFYGVKTELSYEVVFTWWPPLDRDNATPVDQFLILRKNPAKHLSWDDKDVVFHEIVHTISARQPQEQKESISREFLKLCPIEARIPKGQILEEPLAVAVGQIYFLESFHPSDLHWESKMYNNPWISSFAKVIYPAIKAEILANGQFSSETGKILGKLCAEYLASAKLLMTKK